MRSPLYFDWAVSTLFGWGVYGLNLLRYWPSIAGTPAYTLPQIHLDSLAGMDPLGLRAIAQPLVDSDELRLRREAAAWPATLDGVVLHALGNQFRGSARAEEGGPRGIANAGVIFFEDTTLSNATTIAREYDVFIAGCSWCEEVLRDRGVRNVATVLQGVDPSLFHPAPRAGALEGRFAVFSGGKLERRKAQDIVLRAFRAFAARHADALLVTSWHSPWPVAALTLNDRAGIAPVEFSAGGRLDPTAWAEANGISRDQFTDLGIVPNHLMPRVLREMDVAVFPNRCEGGTNLVAMECMACGVPTVVADNTGQRDLVATGAPYVLSRQHPVTVEGFGTDGWGESDTEELVETLEHVYRHRDDAARRGLAGAAAMAAWSWRNQIGHLCDVLAPLRTQAAA